MEECFTYGEKETACLKARDKKPGAVIDRIGHIDRPVDDDLFGAVVHTSLVSRSPQKHSRHSGNG